MQPKQNNNQQSPQPVSNNPGVPVSDIYPASPTSTSQPNSYLPVGTPTNTANNGQKPEKHKNGHNGWRGILSTILLLAIAPLIAFSITSYAIQSYQVDGESMETTLQNGDRLIVDKVPRTLARITGHTYIPHRGDIVIFNQTNLPDTSFGQTKQLIKRVIGVPGERVKVDNGKITVYNKEFPQGFNPDTSSGYKIDAKSTPGEVDVTLAKDQIFVSGDNRPNSEDSRYFGPINANDIVGKLTLRLLPINKAQKF